MVLRIDKYSTSRYTFQTTLAAFDLLRDEELAILPLSLLPKEHRSTRHLLPNEECYNKQHRAYDNQSHERHDTIKQPLAPHKKS